VASALRKDDEALIEASRERASGAMTRAETRAHAVSIAGFILGACLLAALASSDRATSPLVAAVLVVCLALASRAEFEVGSGTAVPTQIAFVPLLFAAPARLVPLLVALAYVLAVVPDLVRGRGLAARLFVPLSCCWYALAPAGVLVAAGEPRASFGNGLVLVAALAAMLVADATVTLVRERAALGVRPREIAAPLAWVAAIDALLAPVGLAVAIAVQADEPAVLAVPALISLLWLFASQWRAKTDQALELRDERAAKARLETLARTDALTGLLNRRGWDEEIALAVARAERSGEPLCVAVIDLDHFKRYNDRYGHQAGDRLLQAAAAAWSGQARRIDVLARYGGEEFAVALPSCDLREAEEVMGRLRRACPGRATCSIGLARWDGEESTDGVVHRADRALYRAKEDGRDRLMVDEGEASDCPPRAPGAHATAP
jgi:diguanylate cyclase (GGDEF)-like protein